MTRTLTILATILITVSVDASANEYLADNLEFVEAACAIIQTLRDVLAGSK